MKKKQKTKKLGFFLLLVTTIIYFLTPDNLSLFDKIILGIILVGGTIYLGVKAWE